MIGLIITAAGLSTRFGSDKTCFKLNKRPLYELVLTVFSEISDISQCCVVCNKNNMNEILHFVKNHNWRFNVEVILGGETRFCSVKNGFLALKECNKILIHDVARPFVSSRLIKQIIAESKNKMAVIPGIKLADTIKECDENNVVLKTLDRDVLKAIQTPQCFKYEAFKKAIKDFKNENITDESQLFEMTGIPVHIIEGDPKNIKITWQTDL